MQFKKSANSKKKNPTAKDTNLNLIFFVWARGVAKKSILICKIAKLHYQLFLQDN